MAVKKTSKRNPHALFWSLLKEIPGYKPEYKDIIKEGEVHKWSGGKTCSLSQMYRKYPAEYSLMIESLKGDACRRQMRYDESRDKSAKRVIGAICNWLDKLKYTFETPEDKIRYAISIACRAANCANFNKIPESRLTAIYSLYCQKNSVEIEGNPALDYVICEN